MPSTLSRPRRRKTREQVQQERDDALSRAVGNMSVRNYGEIIGGFAARGIPEADILPRENVFTYRAWQALGRQVQRGERGIKITTWIPIPDKRDPETGEVRRGGMRPKYATVFHVSQTAPMD